MTSVFEAAARGPGRPKPSAVSVDIKLEQHFTTRVYTSGSTVRGTATIRCARDTPYDAVEVLLTGTTATRLDFVQSYTSSAVRNFMKLRMPIADDALPTSPRVLAAGATYTIPFHFVVPHQLTVNACCHGHTPAAVQEHHLRLPPTLGYWDGDDQAPNVTHIEYAVKARVIPSKPASSSAPTTPEGHVGPIETKKIIKVMPSRPEEPPLDIRRRYDERYCLAKTKLLRKNLVGPKTGELTAEAAQPRAVMMHADGFGARATEAAVHLRWAAAHHDALPPRVNSVAAKLVATTFFGQAPINSLPNLGPKTAYSHSQVLTYSAATPLATVRPEGLAWSVDQPRRDSGYMSGVSPDAAEGTASASSSRSNSRSRSSGGKLSSAPAANYSARIDVPVVLPISNKRVFLPTFYNCLMSRTYALQLVLSVGPANTTLTLHVPIQLGVESVFDDPTDNALPSFESAMAQDEEAEADEYLRPRIMHPPAGPAQMPAGLPGYHDLPGRSMAVAY